MWWWSNGGPAPWMFFGPMMWLILVVVCMAAMCMTMRASMRRTSAEPGSAKSGSSSPRSPASDRNAAFDEYRDETLRRLDREQKEFQDFIAHLRMAKDKAEFDQFIAQRRNQPSSLPIIG